MAYYEIVFWGGPKDGHIEHQVAEPSDEIYCIDNTSPLLDINQVRSEMKDNPVRTSQYSIYIGKKITKRKFKYTFSGLL